MDLGLEKTIEIVARFGTVDVFEIIRLAGISLVYESWHPVTIGEFERKTKTIRVNRRALDENDKALEKKIIAHELGHFFAADLKLSKEDEEIFARAFADKLSELAKS